MSSPEPPSGPPAEAGSPTPAEPGHRARALAASLLGELTGQRKTGLTFSPLEPTGLAVEQRTTQPAAAPSPADDAAPAAVSAEEAAADAPVVVAETPAPPADDDEAATVAPGPVPQLDRAVTEVPRVQADAPQQGASQQGVGAASETEARPTPTAGAEGLRTPSVAAAGTPSASTPSVTTPSAATPSVTTPPATPSSPVPPATPPQAAAPQQSAPQQSAPQQAAPQQTQQSAPQQQAPAAERPAPTVSAAPTASASLAQQSAPAAAPVRSSEGGSGGGQDVRPAPFAYLAVAQHHTTPARATANGALDQAGQRISSRVDRALVRRAALVTIEAASLLDACDVLDGRARAADATWTGEHHSPTEVREFEGAWGAFYDAQGALAQHVTGA